MTLNYYGNEHGSDEERSAATCGRRSVVDCGVGPADVTTTDSTLRSMIDDAMQLLDSMAHDADLAFRQTHGGATRVRDKSNPDRFGNGHSAEAKRISLECKKLRRMVRFFSSTPAGQSVTALSYASG